jgi:UDP-N-acetyl-D-galactosamine dehydrogenase
LTFKENCPDVRNTRVVDIIEELRSYGAQIDVYDPWVDTEETQQEYGIIPVPEPEKGAYDTVVLAVAHSQFKSIGASGLRQYCKPNSVLYDIKYLLPATESDDRL